MLHTKLIIRPKKELIHTAQVDETGKKKKNIKKKKANVITKYVHPTAE